jgi:hypothetical protein
VFIPKEVKVLCFDTLLQVLILKGLALPSAGPSKSKTPAGMLALRR